MSADLSTVHVVGRGPGWQELQRTGHWRELVGWVARLDQQGRLLAPAEHQNESGNLSTVTVRIRTPQPEPPAPRVVRRSLHPDTVRLLLTLAVLTAGLGVLVWVVVQAMTPAVSWVAGNGWLLAAGGVAVVGVVALRRLSRASTSRRGGGHQCAGLRMHCPGCRQQ